MWKEILCPVLSVYFSFYKDDIIFYSQNKKLCRDNEY